MITIQTDTFWVIRYFSVGVRETNPIASVDPAPSRAFRKVGAMVISPLCIDVASAPIGGTALATASEALIVVMMKSRKPWFHLKKLAIAVGMSLG